MSARAKLSQRAWFLGVLTAHPKNHEGGEAMFRTAIFRAAFARSLGIGVTAIFVGFLAAPLVCAQFAWAQDPPPVRIRGTIERVDGTICVVKARDGAELKLTIADHPQIAGIIKASLSDINKTRLLE
jgi:hypothetical protein